jgi:hypothetical protein
MNSRLIWINVVLCVLFSLALIKPRKALGSGFKGWLDFHKKLNNVHEGRVDECQTDPEVKDMCEFCEKKSRDRRTYPSCCKNVDRVRKFCEDYLDYTLAPYNGDGRAV